MHSGEKKTTGDCQITLEGTNWTDLVRMNLQDAGHVRPVTPSLLNIICIPLFTLTIRQDYLLYTNPPIHSQCMLYTHQTEQVWTFWHWNGDIHFIIHSESTVFILLTKKDPPSKKTIQLSQKTTFLIIMTKWKLIFPFYH